MAFWAMFKGLGLTFYLLLGFRYRTTYRIQLRAELGLRAQGFEYVGLLHMNDFLPWDLVLGITPAITGAHTPRCKPHMHLHAVS